MSKVKPINRIEKPEDKRYSPDGPEGGYYWHAISAEALEFIDDPKKDREHKRNNFGKKLTELQGGCSSEEKYIRFLPSKEGIQAWLGDGSKVLKVKSSSIQKKDMKIHPKTGDIYIKGAIVFDNMEIEP